MQCMYTADLEFVFSGLGDKGSTGLVQGGGQGGFCNSSTSLPHPPPVPGAWGVGARDGVWGGGGGGDWPVQKALKTRLDRG